MSKPEYIVLLVLFMAVLSRLTEGGAQLFFNIATSILVVYWLVIEAVAFWQKRKAESQPPFALQTQLYFETEDQREKFAQSMHELIKEQRKEEDPTNGLNEDQLDEMKAEQESPKLSEEGKRFFGSDGESEPALESVDSPAPTPEVPAEKTTRRYRFSDIHQGRGLAARKEILRRYRVEKQNVPQIASEMGYADNTTVFKYLREAGVKLRSRG